MKYYETPTDGDECIHALHPKSSIIETDLSVKCQPDRSHSPKKWLLCDIAMVLLFGAGCFRYLYPTDAHAAARDTVLAQLGDDEVELAWSKQHLVELEDRVKQISEDDAAAKTLFKEGQARELEVEKRLARTEKENESLRMELHEMFQAKPAPTFPSLRGNNGEEFEFVLDDIVEIHTPDLNSPPESRADIMPLKVVGRESRDGVALYKLAQVGDGYLKSSLIPEKHLRHYQPYKEGMEAICNMGNFYEQHYYDCTILGYNPVAERGLKILLGTYEVEIHNYEAVDNMDITLPAWMIKRGANESD